MDTKNLLIALIALVVGMALGYLVASQNLVEPTSAAAVIEYVCAQNPVSCEGIMKALEHMPDVAR